MGHVPLPPPPWSLTLGQQARLLERDVARRGSRLWRIGWGRRSAYSACVALIRIREHDLYGWHDLSHVGSCGRGVGGCEVKAPPKPLKAATPTYRPRPRGYEWDLAAIAPRDPGKPSTL